MAKVLVLGAGVAGHTAALLLKYPNIYADTTDSTGVPAAA